MPIALIPANVMFNEKRLSAQTMKKSNGFTLIEVLISLVVLSLGLLGLAALQASSLKSNQGAYYRSQAAQFAYNIADRMRANVAEAKKGATSKYITTVVADAAAKSVCTTVNGNCSSANMAENDLYEWYDNLAAELPMAEASILFDATDNVFTVSIQWDDYRDGTLDPLDYTYLTSFKL
jgi:type IV pilus assembly protein PilV